jgi:hypothetical protein
MQRKNENPMDSPREKGEAHQKPNPDKQQAPKVFKDDAAPQLEGQQTGTDA